MSTQVSTPQWTPDGARILLVDNERINNRFREGYNKLRVIDLATRSGTFHAVAPAPCQIAERDEGAAALSPDGSKVAFIMDSRLHVMPVDAAGAPTGPARQVGEDIADLPSWGGDSQTILYKSAERVRTVRKDGSGRRGIPVELTFHQAVPTGRTVIYAGRLWDGVGLPDHQRPVRGRAAAPEHRAARGAGGPASCSGRACSCRRRCGRATACSTTSRAPCARRPSPNSRSTRPSASTSTS